MMKVEGEGQVEKGCWSGRDALINVFEARPDIASIASVWWVLFQSGISQ
jgi:hypothetical protein